MTNVYRLISACVLFQVLTVGNAWSHESKTYYDRIHLSVTESSKLDNDTMVVIVYAQKEGKNASDMAAAVNKTIRWGLELVEKHAQIKHQTNAYSSNPIYNNNKIKGWRVRQSLRLESQDMALMSDVLGELQKELALQSMRFEISPQRKNKQDDELIEKAIAAFERRAKKISRKLGSRDYKIVDINISTAGGGGIRPQYQMRAMAMEADSSPAISAGEQTVSVTVSGSIELD